MESPFPGMDPYLERFWNDVHGTLITYIRDGLNELLPPRFRATLQVRVVLAHLDPPAHDVRFPDVAVVQVPAIDDGGSDEGEGNEGGGGAATAVLPHTGLARPPVLIKFRVEPRKEHSIEILDTKSGETVITAIEILSPDNKRSGDGMRQFQTKQVEYRYADVNRVEIDLLRRGTRLFDFREDSLTPRQRKPYYVTVYPAHRPGECQLYAIDLRDPLPVIRIPLRAADPEVKLDLQPLIRQVYRNGRFPIDYGQPCDPPLEGADLDWAGPLLRASAAAASSSSQHLAS